MNPHREDIPGYGVDADPSRRPGVPQYQKPLRPHPNAKYPPPVQESEVKQLMHGRPHKDYPPVWGTAQPPSGVAGAIRKLAYSWPDHRPKHWVALLFADRVDVLEHRLKKAFPFLAAAGGAIALGSFLTKRRGDDRAYAWR